MNFQMSKSISETSNALAFSENLFSKKNYGGLYTINIIQ